MGYFRLFYYIAYVLNFIMRMLKRHGKFILLLVCIFIFLIVCMYNPKSNAAYEGDMTYSDPNTNEYRYYNSVVIDFLTYYDKLPESNYKTDIKDKIMSGNYYIYVYFGGSTQKNGLYMSNFPVERNFTYILFVPTYSGMWTRSLSSYEYVNIDYTAMDKWTCTMVTFVGTYTTYEWTNYRLRHDYAGVDKMTVSVNDEYYIPSIPMATYNEYIYDYFYNDYSLQEIQLLYEMNEKLSTIDDILQDTQDYLTEQPSENDFSSSDLPSDSGVTDTTTDGLNNYFADFYNAFTGQASNTNRYNIVVPIPFTGKSFTIPYNLTSNAINNMTWLKNIISAFWYYIIARYIIIDLINKFEKIQTGNIENLENENIKEDML